MGRQEKLEREMSELKESTLAEEEVVRLVEMKCAKLRQEIFCFKKVSLIFLKSQGRAGGEDDRNGGGEGEGRRQ